MDYVDDLLPDVMFRAPDVPDTILRQMIRDGAYDFLQTSEVWRETAQPVFTFDGVDSYEFFFDCDVRIVRLHSIVIDDHEIPTAEIDELGLQKGDVAFVTNDDPHRLLLGPHTRRGWAIINASIAPNRSQRDLPHHLIRDFRDAFISAALARIYAMPGSGWFDAEVARLYQDSVAGASLRGKRLVNNRRKETRRVVKYGGI